MMVQYDHPFVYRSGTMMAVVIMFVIFFSVGISALVLLVTGVLAATPAILAAAAIWTTLSGLAAWNMETAVEMRPEGLRFQYLIKPAHTVEYSRIQRISIRMMRGWYYCFVRFGSGLFDATFFPVEYWLNNNKIKTNAFMAVLADRANLIQTGKTPLGAPIYERRNAR